jgi:hypothetical protein
MEREENTTALVEETVDTQETTQETAETSAEVTFDQNAFSDIQESNDSETTEETTSENTDEVQDDLEIEWDLENTEESSTEQTTETENTEEQAESNSEETTNVEVNYEAISDKIGVEVKSEEDFLNYIQEKDKKIEELQQMTKGNVTNERIENLKSYISLDDKELLKADFKAQGFTDAEIDEAVDTYVDNGTVKIEAKKIRNTLNRTIDGERNKMIEDQKANAKREEQEVQELRGNIKKFIDNSKTMFGFKMAKDETTLQQVRDSHYKYTTEKFYKDITESEQTMAEAAWLWKNKDAILNAAKNRGTQTGKKAILDEITVPDTSTTTRIREESSGEFNADKFAS